MVGMQIVALCRSNGNAVGASLMNASGESGSPLMNCIAMLAIVKRAWGESFRVGWGPKKTPSAPDSQGRGAG